MLNTDCMRYLTSIIEIPKEELHLDQIPMVCEYPYVFHDELAGYHLDIEIDFAIELALGTTPISKPPYRMTPFELKELKKQL